MTKEKIDAALQPFLLGEPITYTALRFILYTLCAPDAAPSAPPAEEKPRDRAEEMAEELVNSFDDISSTMVADALRGYADEVLERAAIICEGWHGRRLDNHDPASVDGKAFGRGVDMASHYIAADIRRAKSSAPKP